jgi:hypothetical protein
MGETVSFLRAPDAGNPHVRCDEREQETELCPTGLRRRGESLANRHRETNATAPVLDSTKTGHFNLGPNAQTPRSAYPFWGCPSS